MGKASRDADTVRQEFDPDVHAPGHETFRLGGQYSTELTKKYQTYLKREPTKNKAEIQIPPFPCVITFQSFRDFIPPLSASLKQANARADRNIETFDTAQHGNGDQLITDFAGESPHALSFRAQHPGDRTV